MDSPMPGVFSVTLARKGVAGPTSSECKPEASFTIPPIYMLGNRRRDALDLNSNKSCPPAPLAIEKSVHVIKVQVDCQIANYHSSPSCSCSSTSMLCGDPTPRALPCALETRTKPHSPTRAKPPQLDRAAVCGRALPNFRAMENWAVWLSYHGLDSTLRAVYSVDVSTHAVRVNYAVRTDKSVS
jgi:hypothetical protein